MEKENIEIPSQISKPKFNEKLHEAKITTKNAVAEYKKEKLEEAIPIGGRVEKRIKAILGKKVVKEMDESFIKIFKELKKTDRFPDWVPQLIELDANPIQLYTDSEFCKLYETEEPLIHYVRKHYPNYAVLVAMKRKFYMADLGNYSMRILTERMLISDKALQLGLEISGVYTPKIHEVFEEIPDAVKKQKIEAMLKDIQKGKEGNVID